MASLGPPAQISHEPHSGVGQTAAILRLDLERGLFPSSFVVGSILGGLWAGGCPLFLVTWIALQGSSRQGGRGKEGRQDRSHRVL